MTKKLIITLGNDFQEAIGYLEWEFKAEEFPIEDEGFKDLIIDISQYFNTGDNSNVLIYVGLCGISLIFNL
ncbi:hypothetical protein R0131_15425 [Clostridium sp. AL.422]|uniref:hypothetical protein n=1 Tax=Clostridium TaxID=1485 RepID=UPI00293DB590|nr:MULTISPECIES: hypothetical protein [unclassified Clostridium]MDV4152218.1 hypothetical protein [Clostridium sp. AL.422]